MKNTQSCGSWWFQARWYFFTYIPLPCPQTWIAGKSPTFSSIIVPFGNLHVEFIDIHIVRGFASQPCLRTPKGTYTIISQCLLVKPPCFMVKYQFLTTILTITVPFISYKTPLNHTFSQGEPTFLMLKPRFSIHVGLSENWIKLGYTLLNGHFISFHGDMTTTVTNITNRFRGF